MYVRTVKNIHNSMIKVPADNVNPQQNTTININCPGVKTFIQTAR